MNRNRNEELYIQIGYNGLTGENSNVEFLNLHGEWELCRSTPHWSWDTHTYRIKPEDVKVFDTPCQLNTDFVSDDGDEFDSYVDNLTNKIEVLQEILEELKENGDGLTDRNIMLEDLIDEYQNELSEMLDDEEDEEPEDNTECLFCKIDLLVEKIEKLSSRVDELEDILNIDPDECEEESNGNCSSCDKNDNL